MPGREPHSEQMPVDARARRMLLLGRIIRAAFGVATATLLLLALATYWAAQRDYEMQVAQQWEYRCGFRYGQALFLLVLGSVGALITAAVHREARWLCQSV